MPACHRTRKSAPQIASCHDVHQLPAMLTCRDINMVNGVPWPVMSIQAKWHRFRVLNSAASRPYILQVCADSGVC
jgi:FtsP/CotA-like multicopper oxidase with cupredoxin domain